MAIDKADNAGQALVTGFQQGEFKEGSVSDQGIKELCDGIALYFFEISHGIDGISVYSFATLSAYEESCNNFLANSRYFPVMALTASCSA